MCFTCECLKADIREIEERLKKTACQRRKQRILTGRHRKKLKQPERQAYYSQYYQANREKKLAYCRERYQERKNAHD